MKIIHILHLGYHPRIIIGHTRKNKQKNKYICIHEIIQLIIMKMKMRMKNRSHMYDISRPRGLFIWVETSHVGGKSHLSEVVFIRGLHEKNAPPAWRYFSYQLVCMSVFKYICYFHCLLYFLFLFQFLITSTLLNSIRWIVFFLLNNYKTLNTKSKLNNNSASVEKPKKLLTWKKNIPLQWDLTYLGVRSHLGEVNSFSYKRLVFIK